MGRGISHDDGWAFPPPIFFSVLPKRKRAVDGPKEKNASAGRSARGAYLRPPAGEGWSYLAAVRDGNAFPLGMMFARGSPGYRFLLFPLALPWQLT